MVNGDPKGVERRSSSFTDLRPSLSEVFDDDYDDSEDDEAYLEPGEPVGAFLTPVEHPYVRAERVEEANRELFTTPVKPRLRPVRVVIKEDENSYFPLASISPDISTDMRPSTDSVGSNHSQTSSATPRGSRRSSPSMIRVSNDDRTVTGGFRRSSNRTSNSEERQSTGQGRR